MKLLLVIGGMLGFGIGLLLSWAEQSSGPSTIWHACLAAYVTALLMRWWGRTWRQGLADALREKQASAPPFNPATLLSKANKT
jgi:hypothetical protein